MRSSSFSPRTARRRLAAGAASFLLFAVAGCGATAPSGGTTLPLDSDGGLSDAGPAGDSGPHACGGHLSGSAAGRSAGATCAPSPYLPADAGVTSCTTSTDCPSGDTCLAGKCQWDQCFSDADCPTGQACACATEQVGNAIHRNRCVATACRADSDCAGGGKCSQTTVDLCGGSGPFFACRSAADECRVDADCCASAPSCRYEPTVGHWACAAACHIAG